MQSWKIAVVPRKVACCSRSSSQRSARKPRIIGQVKVGSKKMVVVQSWRSLQVEVVVHVSQKHEMTE